MKRFLAVLAGLMALALLGSFFLRDLSNTPAPVAVAPAVPGTQTGFVLQLSRELAQPPQQSPPAAENIITHPLAAAKRIADPFLELNARQSRHLVYLITAGLIGLLLGLLTRKQRIVHASATPVAPSAEAGGQLEKLRLELDERNDAIHDLEQELERSALAAAETLNLPLQDQVSQQANTISILGDDVAARDARIATQAAELEEKSSRLRALENEFAVLGESEQTHERRLTGQARDIKQLEQELSTRRGEVIALKEELAASVKRFENLDTARIDLLSENETLTSQYSSSQQQLEEIHTTLAEQESELANWKDSAKSLESENETLSGQHASSEQQLGEVRTTLAGQESELANWKDSAKSLEREIELRVESIEQLESELADLQQIVERTRVERNGLDDTVAMLQNRLDNKQAAFDTEQLQQQRSIDELEAELEGRTQRLALLDQQHGDRNELLEELRREIEADQQHIVDLETEIGDLQSQRERMDAWESTLDSYKSDLHTSRQIIDEMRDETARFADTEQQVVDQQETIGDLESELDRQTSLTQNLKRGSDSLMQFKTLAEERQSEIDDLRDQLESTRAESEDWRSRIPPLEKTLGERERELDQMQQSDESRSREMQDLERELADWRVKMTAMESELRERDAGLEDSRAQLDTNRIQLDELEQLRAELGQVRDARDAAMLQAEMESKSRQSREADIENLKQVEEKLAAWDSTVSTLRGDLQERERTVDSLLSDFSGLVGAQVSAAGWTAAVDDLKIRLDAQDRDMAAQREEIEQLEQETAGIDELKHKLHEAQADIEAMRGELDRNQNATMRTEQAKIELSSNRAELKKLKSQIKEKKHRVDELEMQTANWIDRHSTINANYESQTMQLQEIQAEMHALREKFEAQREMILQIRADKLGQDESDEIPTLTTMIRPGGQTPD